MFTGIIRNHGTVKAHNKDTEGKHTLFVDVPETLRQLVIGDSLAVNGVCLTVTAYENGTYSFDIMEETADKTTLGSLAIGHGVHLEPSLRIGDSVDGHFVFGHVDGVGSITTIAHEEQQTKMSVSFPEALKQFIVQKGSIAIDGVSLTVVSVDTATCTFAVQLVPHTWDVTQFSKKHVGDTVNLEIDMLARYARAHT